MCLVITYTYVDTYFTYEHQICSLQGHGLQVLKSLLKYFLSRNCIISEAECALDFFQTEFLLLNLS